MVHSHSKLAWQNFLNFCAHINSSEEFGQLFDLFLTLEEKQHLSFRYLIIKALIEGKLTQREIAETYKVSIAQITRGSNALKIISSELREKIKNSA